MAKRTLRKKLLRKKLLRRTLKRRSLKRSRRTMKRRNTLKRSRKSMKRRNTLKRSRKSMKRRNIYGGLLEYESFHHLSSLPKDVRIEKWKKEGNSQEIKYEMYAIKENSVEKVPLHSKRYSEFKAFNDVLKTKVISLKTEVKPLKTNTNDASNIRSTFDGINTTIRKFPNVGTWISKFVTLSDETFNERRDALDDWLISVLYYIKELSKHQFITYQPYPDGTAEPIFLSPIGREINNEFLRFLNAENYT